MVWACAFFPTVYVLILLFIAWEHFTGRPNSFRRSPRPPEITVEFDDFAVTKRRGDEIIEEFWWDELMKVQINTLGTLACEDFFYLLWGETEEQDMSVGLGQALKSGLGDHIESFPGFDTDEFGRALRTTWDEQFIVWEREESC